MDKRLFFAFVVLLVVTGSASAQSISAQSIVMNTGEQKELTIMLANGTTMSALQFNLHLPEGVELTTGGGNYGAALGTAAISHTLDVQPLDNGDLLFVLYSLDQVAFADGELLRLPLTAGNEAMTSSGTLYSVRTATVDAVSHTCADAPFAVTVNDGTSVQSPLYQEEKTFIYDLQGRRIEHTERGFYIMNGNKVLVH